LRRGGGDRKEHQQGRAANSRPINRKTKEHERWRSSYHQSKKELELILNKYFESSGASKKKHETIRRYQN
jgi:hypothetical protein